MNPLPSSRALALAALCGLLACESGSAGPEIAEAEIAVDVPELHLGYAREGSVEVRNVGGRSVGPIALHTDPVHRLDGASVPGGTLTVDPAEIPTLAAGAATTVSLSVELPAGTAAGGYASALRVSSDVGERRVPVDFAVRASDAEDVAGVTIVEAPETVRQGEPAPIRIDVRGDDGEALESAPLEWSTIPADAAYLDGGRFVAFEPGTLTLVVASGGAADSVDVEVSPRAVSPGTITVEASAPSPGRVTSDLWVHGDAAYTGTWLSRGERSAPGNALFVWDVSDPSAPALADSVIVDARVVNDIKVSADGQTAVLTHELSEDRQNGVTILDLSDPLHPIVVGRFTEELGDGVHNVWLEDDYAYVVVDGRFNGLRILDIGDRADPRVVARYYAGTSFLHDVYVRDGLAFLSHWNAGLVILDVGNGIAGGAPTSPVEVSRLANIGGETHNAWYWPDAAYVFVGEEDFGEPGIMRVVDVSDLRRPRVVATYAVPGETPHNFWLDEERSVLYLAWYGRGIRALDVSGRLLGPLERQGRDIASLIYAGEGECPPLSGTPGTCTWAPQLHRGKLFLADMVEGLVVANPPR